MIRGLFLLIILLFSTNVLAFSWHDLWHTPDQQGQLFMNKAQYKKAQEIFKRVDWAAAAAYKAGDYQRAEELYRGLKTEQGAYNQGNALAYLGHYEKAIEAYNKALSFNPNHQEAIYNRNLLQELLKKEQQQKNQDQKNKDQKNQDQKNKDQKNKDQKNKDQKNQDQKNKDQKNQDQKNKDQQSDKDQQNKQHDKQEQQSDQNKKTEPDQEQGKSEAEKEKQQAKEQWLRLIPDDPGGLLREKFLRDHLKRGNYPP